MAASPTSRRPQPPVRVHGVAPGDEGVMVWLELEAQYLHQNSRVVSEAEFTRWIMRYARVNEWLSYHTENSHRSPAGFPDCVFLRPPELLVVELKSCLLSAKVSSAQAEWLDALDACDVEVKLWKPSDIPEIMRRLKRPSSTW